MDCPSWLDRPMSIPGQAAEGRSPLAGEARASLPGFEWGGVYLDGSFGNT